MFKCVQVAWLNWCIKRANLKLERKRVVGHGMRGGEGVADEENDEK